MANLKEIRIRIASVTNTRQVTSAMKMVSAAKLRKAQDAITKIKPYAQKMQEIVATVSSSVSERFASPLFTGNKSKNVLVIVVTSNKGLCGLYNASVVRSALDWIENNKATIFNNKEVVFATIGRKGYDILAKQNKKIIYRNDELANKPTYELSSEFINNIVARYLLHEVSRVYIFYNCFKNAASQKPVMERLIPITLKKTKGNIISDFILEPNSDAIMKGLVPKMMEIQFHAIVLDATASEHGARMTAMHQATDNATELIDTLRLYYNKARQDAITNELLEIVSGAEALKG